MPRPTPEKIAESSTRISRRRHSICSTLKSTNSLLRQHKRPAKSRNGEPSVAQKKMGSGGTRLSAGHQGGRTLVALLLKYEGKLAKYFLASPLDPASANTLSSDRMYDRAGISPQCAHSMAWKR